MGRENEGSKQAGGLTVYLVEELADARLHCERLKGLLSEAIRLVASSKARDHLFEVAGHLIDNAPRELFLLEKSLDATALAASRLDYEELKWSLLPEKAEELERVLRDVRIPSLPRKSDSYERSTMRTFQAASKNHIAGALRRLADAVEASSQSPKTILTRLARVQMALSQTAEQAVQAAWPFEANSREEVIDGFRSANPSLSKADLEEIADHWEKNRNVVKDKASSVGKRSDDIGELNSLANHVARDLDSLLGSTDRLVFEMDRSDAWEASFTVQDVNKLVRAVDSFRKELFGWGGLSFTKKK